MNNDDKKEAEYPDDNYHVDIEEGVSGRKYDKNERNNEEKEAEFPDDTSPVDME